MFVLKRESTGGWSRSPVGMLAEFRGVQEIISTAEGIRTHSLAYLEVHLLNVEDLAKSKTRHISHGAERHAVPKDTMAEHAYAGGAKVLQLHVSGTRHRRKEVKSRWGGGWIHSERGRRFDGMPLTFIFSLFASAGP